MLPDFFMSPQHYKSLSNGFLLNNKSFSKSWYLYISTLPLASQNTLPHICLCIYLLLKQGVVIKESCFSKSPSIDLQFIYLKFISTSASHLMFQNSGMICHWKFDLLIYYHVSKGDLKLICFRGLSLPRFSYYQTPGNDPVMFLRPLIYVLRFTSPNCQCGL